MENMETHEFEIGAQDMFVDAPAQACIPVTGAPVPPSQVGSAGEAVAGQQERKRRIPVDFIAKAIEDNRANDFSRFVAYMVLFALLVIGASAIHSAFYVDGGMLSSFDPSVAPYSDGDDYVVGHWVSLVPFVGYYLLLLASAVIWGLAWWQLGNVNALLLGLIVALGGAWAVSVLGNVTFASGGGYVNLGDVLPIDAMRALAVGAGAGCAGVSLWAYDYKSNVSRWLCYALSVVVLIMGFVSVVAWI